MSGTPIRSTCFDGISRRIIGVRAELLLAYQVWNTLERFKCCTKQGRIKSLTFEQREIAPFSLFVRSQKKKGNCMSKSVTHTYKGRAVRAHNVSHIWRVALGKAQQAYKHTPDLLSGINLWRELSALDLVMSIERVNGNSLEDFERPFVCEVDRPPHHYEMAFITVQRVDVTSGTGI